MSSRLKRKESISMATNKSKTRRGQKPKIINLHRNILAVMLLSSVICGIVLGHLLSPFINEIFPPIEETSSIVYIMDDDCRIKINETFDESGLIVDIKYEDYPNITDECIVLCYGITRDDNVLKDLDDLLKTEDSVSDIIEELDIKYDIEDTQIYSAIYPEVVLTGGLTFTIDNLLSPSFSFPESPSEIENPLPAFNKEMTLTRKSNVFFQCIGGFMDFKIWYNDMVYEKRMVSVIVPVSIDLKEYIPISEPPEEVMKHISLREEAITLRGETTKWTLKELFFNFDSSSNQIEFQYATISINGIDTKIEAF